MKSWLFCFKFNTEYYSYIITCGKHNDVTYVCNCSVKNMSINDLYQLYTLNSFAQLLLLNCCYTEQKRRAWIVCLLYKDELW